MVVAVARPWASPAPYGGDDPVPTRAPNPSPTVVRLALDSSACVASSARIRTANGPSHALIANGRIRQCRRGGALSVGSGVVSMRAVVRLGSHNARWGALVAADAPQISALCLGGDTRFVVQAGAMDTYGNRSSDRIGVSSGSGCAFCGGVVRRR
jgi:hypothetical protein